MISLLDTPEDHTVRRCVELIERHAPRLMRAGGGALAQENPSSGRRMPQEVRARIRALHRSGRRVVEIAAETGRSRFAVWRVLRGA